MQKLWKLLALLFAVVLVAGACSGDDDEEGADDQSEESDDAGSDDGDDDSGDDDGDDDSGDDDGDGDDGDDVALGQSRDGLYCMATHENPGDSGFWSVVQNGAEAAGADMGVEVRVEGDAAVENQADIVRNCIAEGAVGIAASLAQPEGMVDVLQEAADAGIPVVTLNSGSDVFNDVGAITHVGQDEVPAGEGAGNRMNDAGVSGKVLCIVHEDNIALDQRCDGLEATYSGGEVERFSVVSTGTEDIAGTQSTIVDKLIDDGDVVGILSLNPDVGIAARDAIAEVDVDVALATFDLSPDVLTAVEAGEILFAIDQQQYLQGYLPIVFLVLFNENLNTVGGGLPVLTGPGFVTPDNAADVAALADAGSR